MTPPLLQLEFRTVVSYLSYLQHWMAIILSLHASFMIYLDVLMHVVVLNKLLWCYAMIPAHKFQLVISYPFFSD